MKCPYETIDEAPEFHRVIAQKKALRGQPDDEIARFCGISVDTVRRVLRYDPILRYMDDVRRDQMIRLEVQDATWRRFQDRVIKKLETELENDDTPTSVRLKLYELILDRDPDARFLKQSKPDKRTSIAVVTSDTIEQIKRLGSTLGTTKPAQADVIDLEPQPDSSNSDGTD